MPRSAHRVVVSDAGPLIALGRLDLLHLLPALFAQVLVLTNRAGHVSAIGLLVDTLRASGQRLSNAAVTQALAAASETTE